jgi:hypothetical protein
MIDSAGTSIGLYPLPTAVIPTPALKIDGNNGSDLGFSRHNVTHITALNCTLEVDEGEVEIDIGTKTLIPSTLSLSNGPGATQRQLGPLMMSSGLKVTDYLTEEVGVSKIFYRMVLTRWYKWGSLISSSKSAQGFMSPDSRDCRLNTDSGNVTSDCQKLSVTNLEQ